MRKRRRSSIFDGGIMWSRGDLVVSAESDLFMVMEDEVSGIVDVMRMYPRSVFGIVPWMAREYGWELLYRTSIGGT